VFSRIDHVGLAVVDLDSAIDFYASTFAMACVHTETNEGQGVREAMLAAGDGESRIQLLAALTPDSPIARFLDRSGPGLHHVAYTVTDVRGTADVLRSSGVRVLYDEPRPGTSGSRINFLHPRDTGGVLVEIVEHPPQASGPDGA
jgi:methylmalonyl-CoA/ethylmalonyl-CoA epimerase